jgi:hypothetical protein
VLQKEPIKVVLNYPAQILLVVENKSDRKVNIKSDKIIRGVSMVQQSSSFISSKSLAEESFQSRLVGILGTEASLELGREIIKQGAEKFLEGLRSSVSSVSETEDSLNQTLVDQVRKDTVASLVGDKVLFVDNRVVLLKDQRVAMESGGKVAIAGTIKTGELPNSLGFKCQLNILAADLILSALSYGYFVGTLLDFTPDSTDVRNAFNRGEGPKTGVKVLEPKPLRSSPGISGSIFLERSEGRGFWSVLELDIHGQKKYLSLSKTYKFQVTSDLEGTQELSSTLNITDFPETLEIMRTHYPKGAYIFIKAQAMLALATSDIGREILGGIESKLNEWVEYCFNIKK